MYVCICRAVTETEVVGCIADGACTVKDVVKRSEAGTGCGTCIGKIAALLSAPVDELRSRLQRSACPSGLNTGITPGQDRLTFGDIAG